MKSIRLIIYLWILITISSCTNNTTLDKRFSELPDKDYKKQSDTIDGEEVYYKIATSELSHQEFTNLDDSQTIFIQHNLDMADLLIKKYAEKSSLENYTPQTLDNIIAKWNIDSTIFSYSRETFVNIMGTAFGNYLVKTFKLKWSIISDEYGTDYATINEELKLRSFPFHSVIKAIDQKRDGSLQTISLIIKKQLKELAEEL